MSSRVTWPARLLAWLIAMGVALLVVTLVPGLGGVVVAAALTVTVAMEVRSEVRRHEP